MSELEEAARQVLFHINPAAAGGIRAGGFVTALLNAWERADSENSSRLSAAFPVLGVAVAASRSGGVQALQRLIAHERGEL